jgi:hypothetical protein
MRAHPYPPKGREHRADRLWIIVVFSRHRTTTPPKNKKSYKNGAHRFVSSTS